MKSDKSSKVKLLLKQAGVTQRQIAENLSVSSEFVSQVVRGKRHTARIKSAIADAINAPVSEVWPDHDHQESGEAA